MIFMKERYLGLPTVVSAKDLKGGMVVCSRLLPAGKDVLVKAVVQAIPTYSMSVFQLPAGLCKNLNAILESS